ncbi:MAG: nuclear transport factor 2 family protein [Solirubrobacterales bacterium]|jgi:ketosteroid isomerase-like protein
MASINDEQIRRFYAAFAERDGAAMEACYAPDVRFSDPVFPDLRGPEAGAMWRMLTGQAEDLEIELAEHAAEGDTGSARWIARYTFTRSGRPVVNDVRASFRFGPDALIREHTDDFNFYSWARQALGLSGLLLGWTPIVKGGVRKQARASLDAFIAE